MKRKFLLKPIFGTAIKREEAAEECGKNFLFSSLIVVDELAFIIKIRMFYLCLPYDL